ncbi:Uu.00g026040.m01.CDS01 [Anthostomella pinea]|uniref:Uu.00g026040.m01.CDS01 n=1 Tax=Anthostomella pinea TaxID=933095 RepID=A0AAI8V8G7_9PEZI|nr:Uu.00g026040.m01.CDS01 [Anthostomella pinea]
MSGIVHKVKDAVTGHLHSDHSSKTAEGTHTKAGSDKHHSGPHPPGVHGPTDLNFAPSATHAAPDLVEPHTGGAPTVTDINGLPPSTHAAPDLAEPHAGGAPTTTDINGLPPSTHDAPDLTSGHP